MFRNMFKKTYAKIEPESEKIDIPEGLWKKCRICKEPIFAEDVKSNLYTCPKCGGYFRVHAYRRIEMLVDDGSFIEWNKTMPISNPLDFPDYETKLEEERQNSKLNEAVVTGEATIGNVRTAIAVCDARFMMSSMGRVVGEKITAAVEKATEEKMPIIIFSCSGGARMQEGMISLMQMAKTSAALKRHHEAGQLFISFLTDPTMGGVSASFAMLGDIILAEPKALIGFAGPRVIAQTIGTKLPEGFQSAEFLLEHGFIDAIVERSEQRSVLKKILRAHTSGFKKVARQESQDENIEKVAEKRQKVKAPKTAWDSVLLSRRPDRPTAKDYIDRMFSFFLELHGDRLSGDDGAIVGGIANYYGKPVMVVAEQKGKSIKENKIRNFGMPNPSGYRKVLRLMKHANKFNMPIICIVDTPGAFCGIEAEEKGQAEAIARALFEMSDMTVPILSVVIGEGGSGGALALAVANEVWMLEHSIYSILSPEGFASILYKDAKKSKEAAEVMKITSKELLALGVIDRVIKEDIPLTVDTMDTVIEEMVSNMDDFFEKNSSKSKEEIAEDRYNRFRKF
ncbi:MAG: acetyl-CoA carboxylase carboxyltransferase subunit beta [Lachnoanaerobaculum sp.]|uniref:acetyl-CoA carboxylase, carboxyltransferase subunit beta n=1 Tax=Lachnoanaerobaculum sp. TaxID=2049030 RepID=UPI0025B7A906|nr:acetyl-CoA carboxylase, carboxyltransferase subunit beta [Lachnoanaerobaculum sp.]MBS5880826.1 acetyl-CoA carboxylase carboxyltransferase subunit beta [Lachnoanaerobaculum sp.]